MTTPALRRSLARTRARIAAGVEGTNAKTASEAAGV